MTSDEGALTRPPLTAQEAVLREIRRGIREGRWRPGTSLPQHEIAESLGVSRVPVREALKVLVGEGVLEHRPHYGYVVVQFDVADLEEIYLLRGLLESEAAARAVPLLDEDSLAVMRQSLVDMEETPADDIPRLNRLNRQFHFALYERCEMPRLLRFIRLLWDWSDTYRSAYYSDPVVLQRTINEHHEILIHCEARDPQLVVDSLKKHRHVLTALKAQHSLAQTPHEQPTSRKRAPTPRQQ